MAVVDGRVEATGALAWADSASTRSCLFGTLLDTCEDDVGEAVVLEQPWRIVRMTERVRSLVRGIRRRNWTWEVDADVFGWPAVGGWAWGHAG